MCTNTLGNDNVGSQYTYYEPVVGHDERNYRVHEHLNIQSDSPSVLHPHPNIFFLYKCIHIKSIFSNS